jgi:hypothetical protein
VGRCGAEFLERIRLRSCRRDRGEVRVVYVRIQRLRDVGERNRKAGNPRLIGAMLE